MAAAVGFSSFVALSFVANAGIADPAEGWRQGLPCARWIGCSAGYVMAIYGLTAWRPCIIDGSLGWSFAILVGTQWLIETDAQ